ncbi:DUF3592 domain-containing protein [Actinophytocola oryzae]|uniref:DUF3592 domain-containing protein n=1 Tax=Actinophytocola oryzae TaxID=502181 RepID=A0A4R7V7C5_9PSEU|nr:DUF3592 domain-containing protein [Actinophytocola oryzae]TDV44822.1 hypothetical protein CLV71_11381 [Actinophytocola oryzae]
MVATRRVLVITLLSQVAWALPAGLVLGVAVDWAFLYALGAFALVAVVVLLAFMLRWQRADGRRAALLTSGTRVHARLVDSRATNTRIRNRTLLAHTFEARHGGRVVQAETRAFTHLPLGSCATIAYDTRNPANAVVVEDLDARNGGKRS